MEYIPMAKKLTDIEKAEAICGFIVEGDSVRIAAKRAGLEVTKFMRMLAADDNGPLVKQYLRARETRADMRFERVDDLKEMLLAKALDPQSAKVLIDAEFRQMGKENAKRYGEKMDITSGGAPIPAPQIIMPAPDA